MNNILTPEHVLWPIFIRRLKDELLKQPQIINGHRFKDDFLTIDNCYVRGKMQTISMYEYTICHVLAGNKKVNLNVHVDIARSLKIIYELERDYNIVFNIQETVDFFKQNGCVTDLFVLRNIEKRFKNYRKKIILFNFQGLGDVVVLTAAVRDLKLTYPHLQLNICTSYDDVFLNNPHISNVKLEDNDAECYYVDFRSYPYWDHAQASYPHFLGSMHKSVMYETGLSYNISSLLPNLYVTKQEIETVRQKFKLNRPYWIINAGYRNHEDIDGSLKWWGNKNYQEVVNKFKDQIQFVQIGSDKDNHPELTNVKSLIGKTSIREFIILIYDCFGTFGPISAHVHMAAAFNKPSVIIGGGFEDFVLTKYPKQRLIHSIGLLSCCQDTGCWNGHKQAVCNNRINNICKCMTLIRPQQVIQDIENIMKL
jgi:ADP-heptose:LPS heptosyltransferase